MSTGWVPANTVPVLLRDADIRVEPAPTAALNQQSTMIKLAGFLAPTAPARLAANPVAGVSLARRARERAHALTWERSEGALLAAYAYLGTRNQTAEARADRLQRVSLGDARRIPR